MESRYENLQQCMNYFIQLFYKTGKRYSCTRMKLAKLLSILAFKYAANDIKIFREEIYRYPRCGTFIQYFDAYVEREVYFSYPYVNSKRRISKDKLKENVDIPKIYQDISTLSLQLKNDIEEVFFIFGAYSTMDLSEVLNPIVEYEGICQSDDKIKLDNIVLLYNKLPRNKALNYIFNR